MRIVEGLLHCGLTRRLGFLYMDSWNEGGYVCTLDFLNFIYLDYALSWLQPIFQARDGTVIDRPAKRWKDIFGQCHCG